jgi:hypothetical protein
MTVLRSDADAEPMSAHQSTALHSPDMASFAAETEVTLPATASAPDAAAPSAATTGASASGIPPSKNKKYYPDRDAFIKVSTFISLHSHSQHHAVAY